MQNIQHAIELVVDSLESNTKDLNSKIQNINYELKGLEDKFDLKFIKNTLCQAVLKFDKEIKYLTDELQYTRTKLFALEKQNQANVKKLEDMTSGTWMNSFVEAVKNIHIANQIVMPDMEEHKRIEYSNGFPTDIKTLRTQVKPKENVNGQ